MKQFQDYKKLFNILLLLIILTIPISFSLAQSASEIREKIEEKDSGIKELEKEIAVYQAELNSLGQQKDSLNKALKELEINRKKLNADISVTENKIDKTNLKIQNLSNDIGNKESSILNNTKAVSLGIKEISELENRSILESILSSDDFSLVWSDIDNSMAVREKIRERTAELRQIKGELEDTREETVEAKNELLDLKSKLADQKKIVEQNANEKKKLLNETQNNESSYQKILVDRLAKKEALEKELRDYESQLQYILDPSKLPKAGIFSWPLDYVLITQLFGVTSDSGRLYASGSHSGVDFRASIGTPVKAMADGTVRGTGNTDLQCPGASFGGFILIEYDNGLFSTYGHLSLVKVKKGQKVKRGQIVAYSGNTGYSTGPHLHVTVYAPDSVTVKSIPSQSCPGKALTLPVASVKAYLDPMYFLPSSGYALK